MVELSGEIFPDLLARTKYLRWCEVERLPAPLQNVGDVLFHICSWNVRVALPQQRRAGRGRAAEHIGCSDAVGTIKRIGR